MRICVLGTGYVGLVAGACFSDSGNHVTCVDLNQEKINQLNKGIIPIFEPGLDEIVIRNHKANRLKFSSDAPKTISECDVIFIAVGTPSADDGSLDLKYVLAATQMIRENMSQPVTVVLKSTVPVGTADKVRAGLKGARYPFDVVSNPEFLKEGTAVNDFMRPERVIVGCQTAEAKRLMSDLYAPYIRSGNPLLFMDNRSAELTKYAANAFLAMKISFINEMAQLSEKVGAQIHDVRKGIISDSRIGSQFLYPGCGYGGSCFPKDVLGLIHLGKEYGIEMGLFSEVHSVNERQKRVIFEKIQKHFGKNIKGKTIAIWGLAFKPMTDDVREAPALRLITELMACGAKVVAYDPVAKHEVQRVFEDQVELTTDAYSALHGADALAIMTEWNEFRTPDFKLIKKELSQPVIFDGRNLYDPQSLESQGFRYYCIGRPDQV